MKLEKRNCFEVLQYLQDQKCTIVRITLMSLPTHWPSTIYSRKSMLLIDSFIITVCYVCRVVRHFLKNKYPACKKLPLATTAHLVITKMDL